MDLSYDKSWSVEQIFKLGKYRGFWKQLHGDRTTVYCSGLLVLFASLLFFKELREEWKERCGKKKAMER